MSGDGAEFAVLLMPTKEEVYLPLLDRPSFDVVASVAAEFERLAIPYVDLTTRFRERAGARDFLEVDVHLNAAGYRLVADVVLEHLKAHATGYGLRDWD